MLPGRARFCVTNPSLRHPPRAGRRARPARAGRTPRAGRLLRWTCLLVLALLPLGVWARPGLAAPEGGPFGGGPALEGEKLVTDLVLETQSVEPGTKAITVGLRLRHAEHFHTYWKHPGDSGLPTTAKWKLPAGWTVGEFQWPAPVRVILPGEVAGYVYEGTVALLSEVTLAPDTPEGDYHLSADVEALVCDDNSCDPFSAQVSLMVRVVKASPNASEHKPLFDAMRALLPRDLPAGVQARTVTGDTTIALTLTGPGPWREPDASLLFFCDNKEKAIHYAGDQPVTRSDESVTLALPRPKKRPKQPTELSGVLVVERAGTRTAFTVKTPLVWLGAPGAGVASPPASPGGAAAPAAPAAPAASSAADAGHDAPGAGALEACRGWTPEPGTPLAIHAGEVGPDGIMRRYTDDELGGNEGSDRPSLLLLVLFAFLGGMILNLMPCVLPVLSIKILGFVSQAGEDPRVARRHGYAFALGVLASFWLLAGIVLGFKAAGNELGWGFQLQEPGFVAALALLMCAVGLNLFGVFEVGASVMNLAGEASQKIHATGYASSFWSGALATAIATPCTAPFMGPALAYAMTAPPVECVLLFTALGLGMAGPYVLLTMSPRLLKKVPRPGPWMDTFKHALAFPMFAVALYLAWVFGAQTGLDGATLLLFGLLSFSIGLWVYGQWGGPEQAPRRRWILGRLLPLGFVLLAVLGCVVPATRKTAPKHGGGGGWDLWEPWKVACHLKEGRPVLVDATATWCLSCQANKAAVLNTDTVREAAAKHNVALLEMDWTNPDEAIKSFLTSIRRTSVPQYVVFSPHHPPRVLRNPITPGYVAEALEDAARAGR